VAVLENASGQAGLVSAPAGLAAHTAGPSKTAAAPAVTTARCIRLRIIVLPPFQG
jgi:hypothetical protein